MDQVKRFYIIRNSDTELIKGWRGHRIEKRWLYVLSGSFNIGLIKINNWKSPDPKLDTERVVLKSSELKILHISTGYCTTFRALENDSELLVYADYPTSHDSLYNYSWPLSFFFNSNYI